MDEVNEFDETKVEFFDELVEFKTFTFSRKLKKKATLAKLCAL